MGNRLYGMFLCFQWVYWNHIHTVYVVFGSKRLHISLFGSHHHLQVWEKSQTTRWLSRAIRINSSRPAQKDKYKYEHVQVHNVWVQYKYVCSVKCSLDVVFMYMVQWFEKCRQLWIKCGPQWDEASFNLSEDFFDALMVSSTLCVTILLTCAPDVGFSNLKQFSFFITGGAWLMQRGYSFTFLYFYSIFSICVFNP